MDQRRAAALGMLAEPARAAAILAGDPDPGTTRTVAVTVHLPAGAIASGEPGVIGVIPGVGALTREAVVEFLGSDPSLTMRESASTMWVCGEMG